MYALRFCILITSLQALSMERWSLKLHLQFFCLYK